jgi:hypothetical protein
MSQKIWVSHLNGVEFMTISYNQKVMGLKNFPIKNTAYENIFETMTILIK